MARRRSRVTQFATCVVVIGAVVARRKHLSAPAVAADPPGAVKAQARRDSGIGPAFVVKPYLQYPTRDSIKVMWETDVTGDSVVEYGPATAIVEKEKRR